MAQRAGKSTKDSQTPNCAYSPAFLESPTVGPPADPTSPHLSSICLAPCSFWLVPLGPAVILSFEQGQV